MELRYEESNLFGAWSAKIKAVHEAQEKMCEPIPFRISEDDSKAGIVIDFPDSTYYIDVFDLVNSIFENTHIWVFKVNNDQNGFFIPPRRHGVTFEWNVSLEDLGYFKTFRFTLDDYIDAIRNCVKHLLHASKSGKTIMSGYPNVNSANLQLCLTQLEKTWTLPSKFKPTTTSVIPETLCFNPVNCEFNERAEVGFADRKYVFWLEDWSNSYESIRQDLENIYYKSSARVDIKIELNTSQIQFETENILDKVSPCGNGYGFDYKKLTKVTINPLSNDAPVLCGYCDTKQCISEFYEGLLLHAMRHPVESEHDDGPTLLQFITN